MGHKSAGTVRPQLPPSRHATLATLAAERNLDITDIVRERLVELFEKHSLSDASKVDEKQAQKKGTEEVTYLINVTSMVR